MFSRPKILFLVSLLFVALLNSIPTYLFEFLIFLIIVRWIFRLWLGDIIIYASQLLHRSALQYIAYCMTLCNHNL